jgi:endonuclease/exonuclease/phosphatase family metal-dependent hydrolase
MDWRDETYTRQKLSELANVIQRLDADILLLQEVDINSKRSHHINEAELLVKAGEYPYSACAIVWNKNYVPFPFWPPKFHIGDIKTANCILSKYPMFKHQRIIFDKPDSNPFWYNWGYLDRGAQKLEVQIGSKSLFVVNMHLEAYEEEARENQARLIPTWIQDIKGPLVIGGDFNAIPSDASKRNNFADEPATFYLDDHTIDYLKEGLKDSTEALPTSLCAVKEHLCLTFPANEPTRRLDYLFATRGAKFVDGRTVTEAREASDHLPVLGLVEFDPGQ